MGFMIAAAIVESANKGTYEKLLFDRVLIPLRITTAGFGPMGTVGLEDQPLQHTINYSPILPYPTSDLNPIYNSAGLLHMSIADWALYIKWVINAANGHQTLLHQETANNLFAKTVYISGGSYYALGWGVYNAIWAGSYCLQHSGSNGMNYCVAEVSPGRKAGIIIATNICAGETPNNMFAAKDRLVNFYLSGR
jgi:CubicO group peptidase (beta-lactamase class C family)